MGNFPGHFVHEVPALPDREHRAGMAVCPKELVVITGSLIPVALQESAAPSAESLLICPRVSVRFRRARRAGPLLPPLSVNGRQPAGKNKVRH